MFSDLSTILDIRQSGAHSFVLRLTDGSEFVCEQVVRVLPGRRLVCRGAWNGRAVFAKLFFGKSAASYARRDREGSQWLHSAQVLTPDLLHSAELAQKISVLIYAAIENTQNAEHYWHERPQLHDVLTMELVATIAKHHGAGLIQTDLHLKNFLIQDQFAGELKVYTLDGDGIRKMGRLGIKCKRLRNLATLFSKFDVMNDVSIPELYHQYCSAMGVPYTKRAMTRIIQLTRRIRDQVNRAYADKKVFRTCTDVTVQKSFRCFRAVAADVLINPQTVNLDSYLADFKANLKNGNTCTVGLAQLAEHQVVIKRYNIKNWWHALMRALRPSRAAVSWANAHRLLISNIVTPKPLALIEERWGCLRGRAYFLSVYVDAPDVAKFYVQNTDAEIKQTVAQNLATLFFKLYALQYAHGDCKASNIKIVNDQPMLIDLDSMCAYRPSWIGGWRFARAHVKDLKRFMKNWQDDAPTLALFKQAFQSTYPKAAKPILIRAGIL
jgi:tRNA A-37 threonylcarbamoyl transferase component Bud32